MADEDEVEFSMEFVEEEESKPRGRGRKRKLTPAEQDLYRTPGRPAGNPADKLIIPLRTTVSADVEAAFVELMQKEGVSQGNLIRWALYQLFEAKGLMTPKLKNSATWREIKLSGKISPNKTE